MSGSSSGGEAQANYEGVDPASFDSGRGKGFSMLDEFAQTPQGQAYLNQIAQFKPLITGGNSLLRTKGGGEFDVYRPGIGPHGTGGYDSNYSGLITAYSQWMAGQKQQTGMQKGYREGVAEAPGRQATILTGPAASRTILGG